MESLSDTAINVLWFDDDPSTIASVRERLRGQGVVPWTFDELGDARDHLARAVSQPDLAIPDVIVTDLRIDRLSIGYVDGMDLAEFTDALYKDRFSVPGRVGIASAHPEEIDRVLTEQRVKLAFTYATPDVLNGKFLYLMNDIRMAAARFRRDRWCAEYEKANPVQFNDAGGRLTHRVRYGVVVEVDEDEVTINSWDPFEADEELVLNVSMVQLARVGALGLHQPVRMLEVSDAVDSRQALPALYIHRLEGLQRTGYLPLRPGLEFCLDS